MTISRGISRLGGRFSCQLWRAQRDGRTRDSHKGHTFPFSDETSQLAPPTSTTHDWQLRTAATTTMQQSYRSPRQPARTRSKPYTRRQPPPRSGSIMATIRNIVTAPLSWFSTTDEFEDTPGKRRRALVSPPNADALDEYRSVKRQRVASPPPQPHGYLDPPPTMFQPRPQREGASQDPTSATFLSPTSLNVNTQEHQPDKSGHHLSATVWSRRGQSREVSMDNLPNRLTTRDATMIPLPVSREASLSSVPRDSSVGPVRASFRMRTTLSPIPVGSDYGPNPKRRERDPSEPPPLTALMSNPIFVKPPPNQRSTHRSQSAQPTTTLGALAQTSRAVGFLSPPILWFVVDSWLQHNRISPRESSLHLTHPSSHTHDRTCEIVYFSTIQSEFPPLFQLLCARSTRAKSPSLNWLYTGPHYCRLASVVRRRFQRCSNQRRFTRLSP